MATMRLPKALPAYGIAAIDDGCFHYGEMIHEA